MARRAELLVLGALAAMLAACATTPAPAPATASASKRRLGDAMDEVGRRFRRASRAVKADRWDLAVYDLHELDEVFEEDLKDSKWGGKPQLAKLADAMQAHQLAALHAAVTAHDHAAFATAVADAAKACHDCHKQAEMQYIEVSAEVGAEVPVLEIVPADLTTHE
jgi:hypothetical protein